jgi:hypothetical protein
MEVFHFKTSCPVHVFLPRPGRLWLLPPLRVHPCFMKVFYHVFAPLSFPRCQGTEFFGCGGHLPTLERFVSCQVFCSCLLAEFMNNAVVSSELPRFFLRVFMASCGALQWLESCVNMCDTFVLSPVSSTCRLVSVYLECQDLMDEFVNKVL